MNDLLVLTVRSPQHYVILYNIIFMSGAAHWVAGCVCGVGAAVFLWIGDCFLVAFYKF